MFADESRLTYSVQNRRVTIMDNISHAMFVRNANTFAECTTLDPKIVFNHIQTIQRAIVGKEVAWWAYKPFTRARGELTTKIMEFDRTVRFIVEGKCAELKDTVLIGERGFNVNKLLQDINFAYSMIYSEGTTLHPNVDVVRFYADTGVIVVRNREHNLIVQGKNVTGDSLTNVICNDKLYPTVTYTLEEDYCRFYDTDNNLLLIVPTDFSVITYLGNKGESEETSLWEKES